MKKKLPEETDHSHRRPPPAAFIKWWNPSGTDEISGASIGGHPQARRIWARREGNHFVRHSFGLTPEIAWLAKCYRDEFMEWKSVGCPEPKELLNSSALPPEQQSEGLKKLGAISKKIAKPVLAPAPLDHDPGVGPIEF